ncbi:MAG: peptidoglycan DD-metalloendopeptidase family protein, partial [Alphaproteobacteria bacterium]|nr:peptidoglycan DD-metalloendopeptidase family protein [Alphaproteobacteria bacterium]
MPFPARHRRARGPALAAAVAAFASLLSAGAPAQQVDPKDQLRQIERERSETRARERAAQQEAERLRRETARIKADLVRAAAKLRGEEEAIGEIEDRLSELARNELGRTERLDERRQELAGSLDALARLSRTPPAALLASPQSALDSLRASLLLSNLIPELDRRAAALRVEIAALAALRQKMVEERALLERAKLRQASERAALEKLLEERSRAQSAALASTREARERSQQLEAEAREVKALIERLAEEARRRAEEERRLAEERRRQAEEERRRLAAEARARGEAEARARAAAAAEARAEAERTRRDQIREAAIPPADERGGLALLPARGKLILLFGQAGENGILSRGVSVETPPEARVIAPAEGKIVFAGPFRGYGQLLIIAHSGEYHSLMAGFSRIDGIVGQSVLSGEPVGIMGGGDGEKPVLYLEL